MVSSMYVAELNRDLAIFLAENEARKKAKAEAKARGARERLAPLEDRLKRLLATIPIEVQREGLSLSTLQASLRGRWRGNCHPGELGSALRKMGFKRERRWHDEGGFRALWFPRANPMKWGAGGTNIVLRSTSLLVREKLVASGSR